MYWILHSWYLSILEKLAAVWHCFVIVVNLVKQTWFFCMLLLVGVVLCMPGQHRVLPPLAAIIATKRRGMLAARSCRCSTGICAHLSSRAGFPYWWLHSPIHPKYIPWGCSLTILQAALSWWHCLAEGNQGLPEHGEVWRYRLGRGSYSRNVVWQMALRCFTKCPYRAHWWSICGGAQDESWHHCETLSRRLPNRHLLGPYKPGTLDGNNHDVP